MLDPLYSDLLALLAVAVPPATPTGSGPTRTWTWEAPGEHPYLKIERITLDLSPDGDLLMTLQGAVLLDAHTNTPVDLQALLSGLLRTDEDPHG